MHFWEPGEPEQGLEVRRRWPFLHPDAREVINHHLGARVTNAHGLNGWKYLGISEEANGLSGDDGLLPDCVESGLVGPFCDVFREGVETESRNAERLKPVHLLSHGIRFIFLVENGDPSKD